MLRGIKLQGARNGAYSDSAVENRRSCPGTSDGGPAVGCLFWSLDCSNEAGCHSRGGVAGSSRPSSARLLLYETNRGASLERRQIVDLWGRGRRVVHCPHVHRIRSTPTGHESEGASK